MNKAIKNKTAILSSWIAVNTIGIVAGTIMTFFLYVKLDINSLELTSDRLELIRNLAICGAAQGFILVSLRATILLWAKFNLIFWFAIDIVAMALGMTLPVVYGLIADSPSNIDSSFDNYIIASWVCSWLLPGIVEGLFLGKSKNQKLAWGSINGIAYLVWGFGTVIGIILLASVLDREPSIGSAIAILLVIVLVLGLGLWLNSYIFLALLKRKQAENNSLKAEKLKDLV